MTARRSFLTALASSWPLGSLGSGALSAAALTSTSAGNTRDYHKELGVKPFINAVGPYSSLGGATMWPEVMDAMDYAVKNKAEMADLHHAVGVRIAELVGTEYAMVSAGAASAITLGTAGCMTGLDQEKMHQLPHAENMKNEVILQKEHKYMYDRAMRVPGAKLIYIETEEELRKAVNPKTVMMFYIRKADEKGKIRLKRFVELGKELNIPTLCDAATTVPPISNLLETVKLGFDLCCFSGGKGLRGPYSAGLLIGRKDLVEAAKANGSPNHRAVGRSMKVAPEEYLGMMVALETALNRDEAADLKRSRKMLGNIINSLATVEKVKAEIKVSKDQGAEPYIELEWDESLYKINKEELKLELRNGEPVIEIRAMFLAKGRIHLTAEMLKNGEDIIIANRIKEILISHT